MTNMNWNNLENIDILERIKKESEDHPVMIFKHSTRCPISSMAIDRLERAWQPQEVGNLKPYYLDLIQHREISNKIVEDFGISHESPQVIVIKDRSPVYDNSHMGINYADIRAFIKS